MARLSHVRAGVEARKGVLSHEDANHNNVSFARTNAPAWISGVVQKLGEHKATRLKFWGGGENGNDYSNSPDSVPPNGNVVEVFEEVNPKSVDQTYIRIRLAGDP